MADTPAQPEIDVKQVSDWRELHFSSLDEIVAEGVRLVQHSTGVRPLGNLSLGQALKHVALTMHASLDGFGYAAQPERRAYGIAHKEEIIANRMRPGVKLPPVGEARMIPAACTPEEGLAELQAAAARLTATPPQQDHPYLGVLTPQEWISLHCRHAELHLGFMLG